MHNNRCVGSSSVERHGSQHRAMREARCALRCFFAHHGLASEARSTGGDPFRPRKRGALHGWRPLRPRKRGTLHGVATPSASQARHAPRVATPSASQARRAPRVATPSASQARHAPRVATPSASQARRAPRVATPSASQARRAPQAAAHLSEHEDENDDRPHAYSISCMKPKSMCSCW